MVATRLARSANEATIHAFLLTRSAQRVKNAPNVYYEYLHALHDS